MDNLPVDYSVYTAVVCRLGELQKEVEVLRFEKQEALEREARSKMKGFLFDEVQSVDQRKKHKFHNEVNRILAPYFTPQQIKMFLGWKKCCK